MLKYIKKIFKSAKNVTLNLGKVRIRLLTTYFIEKNTTSRSENVMIAYFSDFSAKLKSSTLWSNYTISSATISTKEDIDVSIYFKLRFPEKSR